jgi:uncharacterized protein YeaO (DUF488 family)
MVPASPMTAQRNASSPRETGFPGGTPSTGLRQWYGHNPGRFEEFARRYRAELDEPERAAAYSQLRELAAHGPLTLLTAAKRSDISEAAVLAGPLKKNASR